MSQPLLRVRDLALTFQTPQGARPVVRRLSFAIAAGETFGLAGESGSGKTLTGLSLMNLLPPGCRRTKGEIWLNGQNLAALSAPQWRALRGRQIAMIFQEPLSVLNPLHRVGKQIAEVLQLQRGLRAAAARTEAEALLRQVELEPVAARSQNFPHELSGGQRQRVLIAMALAADPALLIADEPTTALDVTVQMQILDLLTRIQKQRQLAMLLISHDLGMMRRQAQRVGILRDGALIESGPTAQLFRRPQQAWTRHLLAPAAPLARTPRAKSASSETLLSVRDLSVSFRFGPRSFWRAQKRLAAVHEVSFDLARQRSLGVVGESGSGKTSLARALMRLVPAQGRMHFDGQDLLALKTRALRRSRRAMQMVFQDPFSSLNPRLTVAELVGEGLDVHAPRLSATERQAALREVLRAVELDEGFLARYPHEFSGGQRQRIALARALILKPKLLILDEPSSALDRSAQRQLLALLQRLQAAHGLAYIFISHDLGLVRALAHEILVLRAGKLVESGSAARIWQRPRQAYTKRLLAAARAFALPALPKLPPQPVQKGGRTK